MASLLNNFSETKDVIDSLVCRSESCLTPSSNIFLFKVPGELHMKNCSIEFGERAAYHDPSVVVRFRSGSRLVNRMNDMMRPGRQKSFPHYMIKEINQVSDQNERPCLKNSAW